MELTHSFTVPVGPDVAMDVLTDIERIAPCMPGATIDTVDGDEFTGRVKVKVGPMQVTYRGRAVFVDVDREQHRATIEARAQETRGSGTANATVRAELTEGDGETHVTVVTDLAVTGRPAQFGRGVMNDVGDKLLGRFAECLSAELTSAGTEPTAAGTSEAEVGDAEVTEEIVVAGAPSSNGSAAGPTEQQVAQVAGVAPTQPPSAGVVGAGATAGAAPGAPRAATTPLADGPEQAPPRPTDDTIDLLDVAGAPVARRIVPVAVVIAVLLVLWRWRRR